VTVITDPMAALIRFLKADADTAAMAGTKVYGGELPDAQVQGMGQACIVLRKTGGSLMPISASYVEVSDVRVDAYAYGSTPLQADRLYRCLAGALKQMRSNNQGRTRLYWARPAGGPISLREQDTEWPLTLSTWQVMWSERETP
jgi:hypothetical protein